MSKTNQDGRQRLSKVALAVETVKDVVKELRDTKKLKVSKDIASKRKKICNMCPELLNGKCQVCGCFMSIKIELSVARCPLNHWNAKIVEEAMTGQMSKIEKSKCCG